MHKWFFTHVTHGHSRSNGYIIVLVMFALLILSATGISLLAITSAKYTTSRRAAKTHTAIYAAEAGIAAAKRQLTLDKNFIGFTSPAERTFDDSSDGSATYTVTVTRSGTLWELISVGKIYRPGETRPFQSKTLKVKIAEDTTPPTPIVLPQRIQIGNGGVTVGSLTSLTGAATPLTTNGAISVSSNATITTPSIKAANYACGSPATYPSLCTSPGLTLGAASTINTPTSEICIANGGGGFPSCNQHQLPLPTFDKSLFTAKMQPSSPLASPSCPLWGGTVTLETSRTYTGALPASTGYLTCTIIISGDTYIQGAVDLNSIARLRIADGLTKPPVVIVNGRITINDSSIIPNNNNIGATFISFDSNDSTCSQSATCNTITDADLRVSSIQKNSVELTSGYNTVDSSIWSYFGTVRLNTNLQGRFSNIIAQRLHVTGNNQSVHSVSTGTELHLPGAKPSAWHTVSYQQIYN